MKSIIYPPIKEPDRSMEREAEQHLNQLTKPLKSLGKLEEIVIRLAGITGEKIPSIDQKAIVIFCGDHGIAEEGVSAYPQKLTGLMMENFVRGKAAINVLARQAGANVLVVDVGSKVDVLPESVFNRKVKKGTHHFLYQPAMTKSETLQAIQVGIDIALSLKKKKTQLLAVGEMGIGNTTAASAVAAALTRQPVKQLTGKGTGITDEKLAYKISVIEKALHLHKPNAKDALDVLSKVGGLELAAMAGCYIGAASAQIPVLMDGVISTVAALVAVRLDASVRDYLFASHQSEEPAHQILLKELQLDPCLTMNMRLGEGSGAALAFPLFDAAVAIAREMATFADLGLSE